MWPWRQKFPTLLFSYKRYRNGMAPIIPIMVLAKKRWRKTWAYVDSGAAYSMPTVSEAKRLGLMRIKARRVAVTTSGGRTQAISLHRLWVKLGRTRLSITFGVPRGFDIDFNLFGRKDLFQKYQITFDDAHAVRTFIPHRKTGR